MSPDVLMQVRITVRGRVQGVFFRASAADQARTLSLTGYAVNRADGAVEIIAEGRQSSLERLVEWARIGPSRAIVDEIRTEWSTPTGHFRGFEIR